MNQFWPLEPIWRGETCFILGGGPSLAQADVSRLCGRRVITINSSLPKAVAAGVDDGALYFTDTEWFRAHLAQIAAWRGLVTTVSPTARQMMPDKVKLLQAPLRGDFPALGSGVIRGGRSSGHKAISLAIALGCIRVVLLAYDMRLVEGRSHHHDEYRCRDVEIYEFSFIPAFAGWAAAARAVGVEVLNATPDSALKEFPMTSLDQILEPTHAE